MPTAAIPANWCDRRSAVALAVTTESPNRGTLSSDRRSLGGPPSGTVTRLLVCRSCARLASAPTRCWLICRDLADDGRDRILSTPWLGAKGSRVQIPPPRPTASPTKHPLFEPPPRKNGVKWGAELDENDPATRDLDPRQKGLVPQPLEVGACAGIAMPGVPDQGERELQEFLVGAVGDLEPLDLGLGQADLGSDALLLALEHVEGKRVGEV